MAALTQTVAQVHEAHARLDDRVRLFCVDLKHPVHVA
jgi:hypothetical protein